MDNFCEIAEGIVGEILYPGSIHSAFPGETRNALVDAIEAALQDAYNKGLDRSKDLEQAAHEAVRICDGIQAMTGNAMSAAIAAGSVAAPIAEVLDP